jgi:N-acetylglucosamine-6-phosphate deacetylase
MEFAIAADHVFDGTMLRHHCAVVIEASRIRAVMRRDELPAAIPSHHLPRGAWLVPGFIDTR